MNAQKLAGLSSLFLLLLACGGSGGPGGAPAADPEAAARGRAVWNAEMCSACHGERGEGGELAPTLRNVSRDWSADDLAAYLKNPQAEGARFPRLASVSERYDLEMPGVTSASDAEVRDLVAFLMAGVE